MSIFADAWTAVSAVAAAIAAVGSCAAAWITRSQWARDRDERYEGILLALRLECEQVINIWGHSAAILRTQRIGTWDQHATEIAVRYPEIAVKMKDAGTAVEVANGAIEMRLNIEFDQHDGPGDIARKRNDSSKRARGAAQGAAIKLNEVVEAIEAVRNVVGAR